MNAWKNRQRRMRVRDERRAQFNNLQGWTCISHAFYIHGLHKGGMCMFTGAEFRKVENREHQGKPALVVVAARTYDTTVAWACPGYVDSRVVLPTFPVRPQAQNPLYSCSPATSAAADDLLHWMPRAASA